MYTCFVLRSKFIMHVFPFYICICSVQLSMHYMEECYGNYMVVIIIIIMIMMIMLMMILAITIMMMIIMMIMITV